jgi:hypothetical protein
MITIPQILLILLVLGLFVAMFYACFSSTQGPLSISSFMAHLNLLKNKFENHTPIDPQKERSITEGLQNTIKATCNPSME